MSDIIYSSFRGLSQRDQKLLKQNVFAEVATNAMLHDGALAAYPCPELVCSHGFNPKEIYESDLCECVAYDKPTYIAQHNDLIYYKEDGESALLTCLDDFCAGTPTYYPAIPAPTNAPSAGGGGGSGCGYAPVSYMYTFVAKICGCAFESPPSRVSAESNCAGGATVSGFQSPLAGSGVTHIRIYRFDAGSKTGTETTVLNTSGALLVGEIPIGTGAFADGGGSSATLVAPITYDMEAMPTSPDGIGVSAFSVFSWKGKELFFSVPSMPNLRFQSGRFCFDDDIITAKYWNQSIYIFTERYNYRIDEAAGGNGQVQHSNPPYRFESIMPITNEHGVSSGSTGVFFPTQSGIGVLSGNDSVVISHNFFNTSQWKAIQNDNIRTHVYNQYLFVFSDDWDFTHLFEFEDGTFVNRDYSDHVVYPYKISAMYTDKNGNALFASGNDTYRFVEELPCYDSVTGEEHTAICKDCCPYDYRIKPRHAVEVTDYASAYLNIDPLYGTVVFTLWDKDCGSNIIYQEEFGGCEEHEFRLPSTCLHRNHTIQLTGCAKILELRLSTSGKSMGRNG